MRTIVDIPEEQVAELAQLCQRERLSRAEAIRRAVTLYLEAAQPSTADVFGLWKGRGIDAMDYESTLRREWGE